MINKIEQEYTLHHTSWARGYVSRKSEGRWETYSGKFGTGFKVFRPSWESTRFCRVEYWIA